MQNALIEAGAAVTAVPVFAEKRGGCQIWIKHRAV
ncbi:hypothetical protein MUS_1762 [Bacillus velezensis YAU B9601-Y2]|uniref:Uncharacterized protein n=1 Tax=Bacillus amyloliquefaciens (strain Y2) TaxID=1155777 RepID=I2C537_BACAY|nr:hypothetical protein MUS_1762 [Bacillus velezensis YAU B9601-Y2]